MPPRDRRRGRAWLLLGVLPLLLVGVTAVPQGSSAGRVWGRPGDAGAHVLVAVAALALLLHRRSSTLLLVVSGLAISLYLLRGHPVAPVLLVAPAAVLAAATRLPWRRAVAAGVVFGLVTTAAAAPRFLAPGAAALVERSWYPLWVVAWLAVLTGASAVGAALQVRHRAQEATLAERARRGASDEQLAAARDVHDGVGHGLAVVALHAGVALHVLDRDPQQARELLVSIRETSRESLERLRSDLERWRGSGVPARPALEDLPVLLARMRSGGLELVADVDVAHGEVPRAVGEAAYRVVQESLTNVLRHSGATPARVRVARAGPSLLVEVEDDGTGAGTVGAGPVGAGPVDEGTTGSGTAGMRQRCEALGGRLDAGPAAGGGYAVRAELPLAGAAGAP